MAEERSDELQWYVAAPKRRFRRLRRAIPAVAAVGLLAGAAGAGTMASFSASTDNAGATFEVGTLVLSNTVPNATACLSADGGMPANANDCTQLFDLSVQQPGDGATADIDLENVGTMDGTLAFHAAGPCTGSDATDTSYHGAGDLCDVLRISVQEYADADARAADDTTGGTCLFGGGDAETCDFDDPSATVDALAAAYPDFTDTLPMGTLTSGAASARYLKVSVHLDGTADNDVQGRAASFGLTWRLLQ